MHPPRAATIAHILDQLQAIAWYGLLVATPVYLAMVLLTYLAHVDTLGVALIGAELARTALRLGQGAFVAWTFTSAGLRLYPLTLVFRTTTVFVGGALIVVAEAFRRGAELEDDQALTV